MRLTLLALAVLLSGCAPNRVEVMPMWYRNAPKDWTMPAKYQRLGCCIRDEIVLVNMTPNGLATIRIECKDRTVLLDKQTKRKVWETYW